MASMKVKVTQTMAKAMQKAMPEYSISVVKFSPDGYRMNVDYDLFNNETDYSYKTGKFSAIRIGYPASYYAMPQYITTKQLVKCFNHSDKTLNGFLASVKDFVEI